MIVVCVTGSRPKNLPWGYDESSSGAAILKEELERAVRGYMEMDDVVFRSGMAEGVDTYFAEIVLKLGAKLICVLPCRGQSNKWAKASRLRYERLIVKADDVIYVSGSYTPYCMMQRNMFLVDGSDIVIAVGDSSGTAKTVEYATRLNKKIHRINI